MHHMAATKHQRRTFLKEDILNMLLEEMLIAITLGKLENGLKYNFNGHLDCLVQVQMKRYTCGWEQTGGGRAQWSGMKSMDRFRCGEVFHQVFINIYFKLVVLKKRKMMLI